MCILHLCWLQVKTQCMGMPDFRGRARTIVGKGVCHLRASNPYRTGGEVRECA